MTDEQNSAEREAEQILKGAYISARADECPQGEECPVHFRVDEQVLDYDELFARLITYSGDHVVITDDNPRFEDPALLLKLLMGGVRKEDLPPRWQTTIFYVGSGVVGDLEGKSISEIKDALRYLEEHDEWDSIKGVHDTVVAALQAGLLDVSKPYNKEA